MVTEVKEYSNETDGIPCPKCDGYADKGVATKKEIASPFNCGRSYACCVGVFVCRLCGDRSVVRLAAPEMG